MDEKMRCRKGQVSLWVILAVVLVASIILFFLFSGVIEPEVTEPPSSELVNIKSYISRCTQEIVEEAVGVMLPQGGFVFPKNSKLFDGTEIEYLCENIGFYTPCVNQHPVLIQEMEKEILNEIVPRIEDECFGELDDYVYRVSDGNADVNVDEMLVAEVELGEDRIFVRMNKTVEVTKREQTKVYDKFNVVVINPAYNLGVIAAEITSQEATYCYFENVGYSVLYPRYKIDKYVMSDSTKIYTINDTRTDEFMRIAIKGCVIPPGG